MGSANFSRPELVRLDDPGYRAHCALNARLYRAVSGVAAGPEPLRSALGRALERGARSLLREKRLLSDRRILRYAQRGSGRASEIRYRELDAVAEDADAGHPVSFFEIKSSVSPLRALQKAIRQLRSLQHIVDCVPWGQSVRLAGILIVPTEADLPNTAEVGECTMVRDLDQLAALDWDPLVPAALFMLRDQPWNRAVERGWVEDGELLQRVRDLEAGVVAAPQVFSFGDDAGETSFAAALREALDDREKS